MLEKCCFLGARGGVGHHDEENQVDRSQVVMPVVSLAVMWIHFVLVQS